ncbi:MAG: hypothetical protein P8M79_09810 [Alphaproteobacteria bacterium]|nr:hypothetical protein [Alphaproteobacteria bacterium]
MIVKRAMEGVLIGVMAVAFNACGPVPRPFQTPAELGPPKLTQRDTSGGVRVTIVDGLSAPIAKLLSEAIAQGLVARGIPAMTKGGEALRYTLTGRAAERAPDMGEIAIAKIHWSLNEKDNEPFSTFSQDVRGDWRRGSAGVIRSVGTNTARLIADVVEPEDETLKPVQAVSRGVWVQPVRGAPGDGDKSLTRAIRYALVGAKVAVTSERLAARHILRAEVRVGAPQRGQQAVAISWTLTSSDGRKVGNAVQRNAVPAGTFDGRWGETAVIIATAAVGGIKEVLAQSENAVRFRVASGSRGLKTDLVRGDETPSLPPPNLSLETGSGPKGQ